jgi:hypothetical protein
MSFAPSDSAVKSFCTRRPNTPWVDQASPVKQESRRISQEEK